MAHKPDDFNIEIKDWRERALQRALWRKGTSKLGTVKITWRDIEIPVDNGGKRNSKRIDLIGVGDDDSLVLCELKFGRSKSSPNDAAKQVIEYKDYILAHTESLKCHKKAAKRGGLDWLKLVKKPIHLVLAANSTYWRHWERKLRNEWKDKLASLEKDGIECYELRIENDFFKKQKEKRAESKDDKYTPDLEEPKQNIWTHPLKSIR